MRAVLTHWEDPPMTKLPFKQVDVFTQRPYQGNPVAVVLQGESLQPAQMQRIAHWTNLSETTFVLPPSDPAADYAVRIFTPQAELPFAGHPTLGTAHALLEAGRVRVRDGGLVQQCGAGLVRLQIEGEVPGERWITLDMPSPTCAPLDPEPQQELAAILGQPWLATTTPLCVDVGPRWVVAQLTDADAVLALQPDLGRMARLNAGLQHTGVLVFGAYPAGRGAHFEVRAFAPAHGIAEDPVCGSGNGALGAFLRQHRACAQGAAELLNRQGAALGRDGWIRLRIADDAIQVGGQCVTCIDGTLTP